MYTNASRRRSVNNSYTLSTESDYIIVQPLGSIITEEEEASSVVRIARESEVVISYSGRFGRTVRLPTRFR